MDKTEKELGKSYRWIYPHGGRATKKCVNANKFFKDHLLSDDKMKCLACGAIRILKKTVSSFAHSQQPSS